MVKITLVLDPSPAQRAGICAGMALISLNGKMIRDVLDYQFYAADAVLEVLVDDHGKERCFRVEKDAYEDLGLGFSSYLMDAPKSCENRCVFCFIDQLPKGMRETLYFKDDDARLSLLTGNYITMTNLSREDLEHIAEIRLSPVNISVHAVNGAVRARMLGNKKGALIKEQMLFLAKHKIRMNCQIVLCKNLNDGEILKESLSFLAGLYPEVSSVSVVPAGLTKHREHLFLLADFSPEEAREVVRMVDDFGLGCKKKLGIRLFYLADEFFLKAGLSFPPVDYYEDFPQIENGVGMMASFLDEAKFAVGKLRGPKNPDRGTIVTGTAAYPFIAALVDELKEKCNNLDVKVLKAENEFFGRSVTVAGLLTGSDVIRTLENIDIGGVLYIPTSMLRSEQDLFLDGVSLADLEKTFGVKAKVLPNDGYEFVQRLVSGQPNE